MAGRAFDPTMFQIDVSCPEIGADPGDWVVQRDDDEYPVAVVKLVHASHAAEVLDQITGLARVFDHPRLPGGSSRRSPQRSRLRRLK